LQPFGQDELMAASGAVAEDVDSGSHIPPKPNQREYHRPSRGTAVRRLLHYLKSFWGIALRMLALEA